LVFQNIGLDWLWSGPVPVFSSLRTGLPSTNPTEEGDFMPEELGLIDLHEKLALSKEERKHLSARITFLGQKMIIWRVVSASWSLELNKLPLHSLFPLIHLAEQPI
jgi:hypothetical protein